MNKEAILITGHAGGIGSAIASTLNNAGYTTLGVDRQSALDNVDYEYVGHLQDIVDEPAILQQFLHKSLAGAPLKGVINCAAVQIDKPFEQVSAEDLATSFTVNVTAPFIVAKTALEQLIETNGVVINIGSVHANLTKTRFLPYSVTKSALAGLTRAMSIELGDRVRVMELQPAAIATDMLEAGFANDQENRRKLDRYHPTGTIGTPADVANVCLFLITNETPFLNGAIINFDGGISHMLSDPANENKVL